MARRRAKAETSDLVERLGHSFRLPALLDQALIHASRAGEIADNERLEFLGDRVLGLLVAELLYERFPEAAEGALALRFNALVRKETCAEVARSLDLGRHVRLGAGEERAGRRESATVLGDVCEAVIAAIYLDGGIEAARAFVRRWWTPLAHSIETQLKDAKTVLQEWAQARHLPIPEYVEQGRDGPDHAPRFRVAVLVRGLAAALGEGPSKRAAEQAAAEALLARSGLRQA